MNILWAGSVNNPMDSIEQISYLLFLRLPTEKDDVLASLDKKYVCIFSGKWARYDWGNFVTLTGDNLFNAVRDAVESRLHEPGRRWPRRRGGRAGRTRPVRTESLVLQLGF